MIMDIGMLFASLMFFTAEGADKKQNEPIYYKVYPYFNGDYKSVICIRGQRPTLFSGMFYSMDISHEIERKKISGYPCKKMGEKERIKLDEKIDALPIGVYPIKDLLADESMCIEKSWSCPQYIAVMPSLSDVANFSFKRILFSGPGDKKEIARCMHAVDAMRKKPKKVFFEPYWRAFFAIGSQEEVDKKAEQMNCIIKKIAKEKETHFYGKLFLNKKRNECAQCKNFPLEVQENIFGYVGHPYDELS